MKKFIVVLLIAALAALSVLPMSAAFGYSLDGIDADQLVVNTIISFGVAEDIDTLVMSKDKLYDISLNENGLEYTFNLDGKNGYALLTAFYDEENDLFSFNVEEIFFDKESPYSTSVGKKLYIDQMVYLEYDAGIYRESTTKTILPQEIIDSVLASDSTYCGDGYVSTRIDHIDYKYKYDNYAQVPYGLPVYGSSYLDSCANVAGGVVVGYYDVYKTNMIANYSPLHVVNNKTVFKPEDSTTRAIVDNFYFSMGTYLGNGTTQAGFTTGLTGYVNSRGYSVNYLSVMSGSNFSYSAYRNQIFANRIVVLFLGKYNIISMYIQNTGYDKIFTEFFNIGHVMVGYGFREVNYFRDEEVTVWSPVWYNPFRTITVIETVNFRNDDYLMVNTGLYGLGFMRLNDNEKINNALAIEIV